MTIALRRLDTDAFRGLIKERDRGGFAQPQLDDAAAARLTELFGERVTVVDAVRRIVADVRDRGDGAVREWTARLDGVDVADTRLPRAHLRESFENLEPGLRNSLVAAAQRIREFHEHQRDTGNRGTNSAYLRPEPLRRAGCYVPGGRAAYPSTLLMSVIPAQVAGVASIAVCSPPAPSTAVHPLVSAAAELLGVRELHAIGGAQAIAALAYGTESVARVDKVVGPGNAFVTLAKREVFGAVGIDQLAGPTEILVIASTGADADLIAADLVSQLEHDPLAWAICLTDDARVAAAVGEGFAVAAEAAARSDVISAAAGAHAVVVTCASLEDALELSNGFAPEHLSLQGAAAEALRDSPSTAGAVFVGAFSPVSIGDYIAGPNHTLPTQGAARYRGPLSVQDFVRWPSVVQLDAAEFELLAPVAGALADAEGLHAHGTAIRARLRAPEVSG
ncbi:MAG: histidinol dehydrogenase [Chloroflexi bacterium]|nr:MAG: histidinol dehydrogenase [Chloroflexota bacterium]